uniref:Uncharacterized protein n=1 Tax=Varanus komodoensis TaxID=61221 RepID=A0A8D2LD25_VARKO
MRVVVVFVLQRNYAGRVFFHSQSTCVLPAGGHCVNGGLDWRGF